MRASNVSVEEQYRLVLECRASGLTDCQWCLEHGIKPGTFYNWVKRLKNNPALNLPDVNRRPSAKAKQEIVKIEFQQPVQEESPADTIRYAQEALPGTSMELIAGGMQLRIPNGVDPQLLVCVIRTLKAVSC